MIVLHRLPCHTEISYVPKRSGGVLQVRSCRLHETEEPHRFGRRGVERRTQDGDAVLRLRPRPSG